jgi:NAD(P)-dependent dehydrogenase (short-subunit alcohol dehydrogenase family)
MLERDGGRDRAGVGSHDPTFWHPPGYVSAKHGVIGLTKTAALDYADHNPRVKARAPGPILTDNLRRAGAQAQAAAAAVMPMRRVGQPEKVAWTAVSLRPGEVHHRRSSPTRSCPSTAASSPAPPTFRITLPQPADERR